MEDFEAVYAKYFDIVFQYALSLCRDTLWAEELTQESFFKALKHINTFRGECKLNVWLCQIVKNTYYTEVKKRQRQTDYPSNAISSDTPVEQKVINRETGLELHKILHKLDEPYKEIFWMRTFGELSFAEIGHLMDKSESWARVTYHRAKLKIREEIK